MKRRVLWSVAALLFLLCGAATVVLTTEWGLHFVMARAAGYAPGTLHFDRLSGRLVGPLHIRGLTYRDENTDIRVDGIDLNWAPLALIHGTLHVTTLDMEGVHYTQVRPSAPAIS